LVTIINAGRDPRLARRLKRLEKLVDEQTKRLQAIEAAVQTKIDADAVYQPAVLQAFADLKAKIPDTTALDAELTNLETELGKLQPLVLPT
jgi:xanthine dehydrogenase iron-sulfur cluster and FAD-binding subunit A